MGVRQSTKREREIDDYKITTLGRGKGVTISDKLDDEPFPNQKGQEVTVTLVEDIRPGCDECFLKIEPKNE